MTLAESRPPFPESVPHLDEALPPSAFRTGQSPRWCPGCGDHAVLAAAQSFLSSLRIPKENIVIVSGIGCSSRFPYYVDAYGIHSIHGRAPSIATGIALNRPDLSVWVVTGDGDALSIGGNHLIHALRRNVNIKIMLFNNRIYGLTKGQYSPTSEFGKITKSTPDGSLDHPFSPVSLALGAEATFVARTLDSDRVHLIDTLGAAAAHDGSALIEIYQNCTVFNDDAYSALKDPARKQDWSIRMRHGRPMVFGSAQTAAVVRDPATGGLRIGSASDPGVVIHDAETDDLTYAFALSRLGGPDLRNTPLGVFRAVERETYDYRFRTQMAAAQATGPNDIQSLLAGHDSWTVS